MRQPSVRRSNVALLKHCQGNLWNCIGETRGVFTLGPTPLPTPIPPFPHVLGDLLPRLVALKAADPTFRTTIQITGPVATCVPPFDKLGLHCILLFVPSPLSALLVYPTGPPGSPPCLLPLPLPILSGTACHCGRSRLHFHFPLLLPTLCLFTHLLRFATARLVIVAGPALLSPSSTLSCPTTFSSPPFLSHSFPPRPGLPLWLVPPCTSPFHFTLFWFTFLQARLVIVAGPAFPISILFSNFTPILLFTGPACHCGRSRRVPPPPSLHHPFLAPRPGLSLWQVPPSSPPSLTPLTFSPTSSILVSPLLFLSLLLPPRARRTPWEIQSDLADALPQRIHK